MLCLLLYGSLGSNAVRRGSGCMCVCAWDRVFVSAAACWCVWNECKRHQTPPLICLINDRWNSCCFSSPQHRLLQQKHGTECAGRLTGWLRLEISLMLSATYYTQQDTHKHIFTVKKTPHYSEPAHTLLCRRGYDFHETFIWQITYTGNTHPSVQTHIHTHTHQSPFCAPAGDPAAVMSLLAATLLIVTLIESRTLWFSFKSRHCKH